MGISLELRAQRNDASATIQVVLGMGKAQGSIGSSSDGNIRARQRIRMWSKTSRSRKAWQTSSPLAVNGKPGRPTTRRKRSWRHDAATCEGKTSKGRHTCWNSAEECLVPVAKFAVARNHHCFGRGDAQDRILSSSGNRRPLTHRNATLVRKTVGRMRSTTSSRFTYLYADLKSCGRDGVGNSLKPGESHSWL